MCFDIQMDIRSKVEKKSFIWIMFITARKWWRTSTCQQLTHLAYVPQETFIIFIENGKQINAAEFVFHEFVFRDLLQLRKVCKVYKYDTVYL